MGIPDIGRGAKIVGIFFFQKISMALADQLPILLLILVNFVAETMTITRAEQIVDAIGHGADFRQRPVVKESKLVVSLTEVSMPRELGGDTGRQETAEDVKGPCFDCLLINRFIFVFSPWIFHSQMLTHRRLTASVKCHPLVKGRP